MTNAPIQSEDAPLRIAVSDLPVLGVCGRSGSGKTTLLEAAVGRLQARGLRVAVVRHDAHGLQVDRPGKDSDRFFRAGADVLLQGPGEEFLRCHNPAGPDLSAALCALAERYDVVLVEGHKNTPLPKVWLLSPSEAAPPADVGGILAALPRDSARLDALLRLLDGWLRRQWRRGPLFGCVLMGGKSTRMGRPKHLLRENGRTWLDRTVAVLGEATERVVLAGGGAVPEALSGLVRLPDVAEVSGPMAGMLSAMRWAPRASWIVAACDLPNLSVDALQWLASFRSPGVWAALPRLAGARGIEPLLAYYDFRAHWLLERLAAAGSYKPADLIASPKVLTPSPAAALAPAWRNVNTQAELRADFHQVG